MPVGSSGSMRLSTPHSGIDTVEPELLADTHAVTARGIGNARACLP